MDDFTKICQRVEQWFKENSVKGLPFQVPGESVIKGEEDSFNIIRCPRCKGMGGYYNHDGDPCMCEGEGKIRKYDNVPGWYVTISGKEFCY